MIGSADDQRANRRTGWHRTRAETRGSPADAPHPELYVARPDFRQQVEWLDDHGYQAVTLEQVEDAWDDGGTLPPRPVVISFDGGYRSQFTFALPQCASTAGPGFLNLKAEGSDLRKQPPRQLRA